MKPLSDQWTSYSGDLSGKRYSALKQSTRTPSRISASSGSRRSTTGCGPTGTRRRPAPPVARRRRWRRRARRRWRRADHADRRRRPGQRRREHLRDRRASAAASCSSTASSTRRRRTTSTRSTRATARCSGTTTGRRAAAPRLQTRGPGMWRNYIYFTHARRLGGLPRRQDRQGSLAARDRAVRSAVLLVERADGRSAITCSSAPATTSTRRRS